MTQNRAQVDDALRKRVLELNDQDLARGIIAKRLDVSKATVAKILKQAGKGNPRGAQDYARIERGE